MPINSPPKTRYVLRPQPGEVRIRQRAIGVNYIDVYLRKGWIPPMLAEAARPAWKPPAA